jgi:hypothetical protein
MMAPRGERHPQVINTPEFLKLQPRVAMFLNDHPEIAAEVRKNPATFLQHAYDTQPTLERGQDPDLQDYLARHPQVAQQLRDNSKFRGIYWLTPSRMG